MLQRHINRLSTQISELNRQLKELESREKKLRDRNAELSKAIDTIEQFVADFQDDPELLDELKTKLLKLFPTPEPTPDPEPETIEVETESEGDTAPEPAGEPNLEPQPEPEDDNIDEQEAELAGRIFLSDNCYRIGSSIYANFRTKKLRNQWAKWFEILIFDGKIEPEDQSIIDGCKCRLWIINHGTRNEEEWFEQLSQIDFTITPDEFEKRRKESDRKPEPEPEPMPEPEIKWCEIAPIFLTGEDVSATYFDWKIRLDCPNGGIVGVSVESPDDKEAYQFGTELFQKFHDKDWHINQAIEFLKPLLDAHRSEAKTPETEPEEFTEIYEEATFHPEEKTLTLRTDSGDLATQIGEYIVGTAWLCADYEISKNADGFELKLNGVIDRKSADDAIAIAERFEYNYMMEIEPKPEITLPEFSYQELGQNSGYFVAFYKEKNPSEAANEWQKMGAIVRDKQGFYSFAGGDNFQDISEAVRALYECNICGGEEIAS